MLHNPRSLVTLILILCESIVIAGSPGQYFCFVAENSDCIAMSERDTDPVLDLIETKIIETKVVETRLVTSNKSIEKTFSKENELEVYTNSSSSVSFLLNINKTSRLVIIENSEGRVVYSSVIDASNPTLNTEDLIQGSYNLKTYDVFSDLTGETVFVKM